MKRWLKSATVAVALCLPVLASARGAVEEIDVLDVSEVDVLFKCEASTVSADDAVFRLAHRFARHRHRVFSAMSSDSECRFGYVAAPYQVSAPAFFERDGQILACVTVQGVASLLAGEADEDAPEPPTDAPPPLDPEVEEGLDPSAPVVLPEPTDASPSADRPGYEEDDDLKIPKDVSPPVSVPADDDNLLLDPNNAVDSDLFGDPTADAPAVDEDAGPPMATEPNRPGLLTDLPAPPAATDPNAERLPTPDASHGPIFIDGQPAPDVDEQIAPGWEVIQH